MKNETENCDRWNCQVLRLHSQFLAPLIVLEFEMNSIFLNILTVPELKSLSYHHVWNNKNYNDRNKRTSYISRYIK